jgi:hypothetical protein
MKKLLQVAALAVVARVRYQLQDTCRVAVHPQIGTVCIHYPQRWKVWRRRGQFRAVVHYTTASEPARSWEIPFLDARGLASIGLYGEEAVIAYCEIYGTRVDILS